MNLGRDLCPELALRFGRGIQFAEDCSQRQLDDVGSPSTKAARNSIARSHLIGSLSRDKVSGFELGTKWQEYNKVALEDLETAQLYWLKSSSALRWQFELGGSQLFHLDSNFNLLAYRLAADFESISFSQSRIASVRNGQKKFFLESPPTLVGRYPLYAGSKPFDPGVADSYDDIFREDGGEETGT